MGKYFITIMGGILCGLVCGYLAFTIIPQYLLEYDSVASPLSRSNKTPSEKPKRKVIGFLPYWLISVARDDYSSQITTLTYFGLTIDTDGSIMKETNPGEAEPGWHALNSGAATDNFISAKQKGLDLSLLIFAGDQEGIKDLMSDPVPHAQTMMDEVLPIMKEYDFTDLNIDIESVELASESEREHFTLFIQTIKKVLNKHTGITLTIEASPTVLIKPYLIDIHGIVPLADYIVFMTYDYHYPGSFVTGPVAPLSGGGSISEFDVEKAMDRAISIVPEEKIILGMPLYGYEWETLHDFSRAAVIPGSGITASSKRVEELLKNCKNCEIKREEAADESYVVYKDAETGTFHQIFFPDEKATQNKLTFAQSHNLAGVALWALGYESRDVMNPLNNYKE